MADVNISSTRAAALWIACTLSAAAPAHDIRCKPDTPPRDENNHAYTDDVVRAGIGIRLNQGALDVLAQRVSQRLGQWEYYYFPTDINLGSAYTPLTFNHPENGTAISFDYLIQNNTLKNVLLSAPVTAENFKFSFEEPGRLRMAYYDANEGIEGFLRLWYRIEDQTLFQYSQQFESAIRPAVRRQVSEAVPENQEYLFQGKGLKLDAYADFFGTDQWLATKKWALERVEIGELLAAMGEQYLEAVEEAGGLTRAFGMANCTVPEECLRTYINITMKSMSNAAAEPLLSEAREQWKRLSVMTRDSGCSDFSAAVHTQYYRSLIHDGAAISLFHGVYTSCEAPQIKLSEFIALDHQLEEIASFDSVADADIYIPIGNIKPYLASLAVTRFPAERPPSTENLSITMEAEGELLVQIPDASQTARYIVEMDDNTLLLRQSDGSDQFSLIPILTIFPFSGEVELTNVSIRGGYIQAALDFAGLE